MAARKVSPTRTSKEYALRGNSLNEELGIKNVEWSAPPIVNEELRILHSVIAAKRESFNIQQSTFNIMKRETWKTVIQVIISILTAALTAMGTSSCIGALMR